MADKTVSFRPFPPFSFTIVGSEVDRGVVGAVERDQGRYAPGVSRLLRRRLRPDAVMVDIGANVGVLTVLAARLCGEGGRVFAFEPDPENHDYLVRNLAANGAANAVVEQAAVHDTDGQATFAVNAVDPAGAHLTGVGAGTGPGVLVVPSVRLDSWVGSRGLDRLDMIKIDVEGAEPGTLEGAAETIRRLRPTVIVECNPTALRRVSSRSWSDLLRQMRSMFGSVAVVTDRGWAVPVRSADHLELLLGHHGVVDLVGLPPGAASAGIAPAAAGVAQRARLRVEHNRFRPPGRNYPVEPRVSFGIDAAPLTARPSERARVPVTVRNEGRWWLSSTFAYVPIHLSYHWRDGAGTTIVQDGRRTDFPAPLGPGRSVELQLDVELPADPGRYELVVTLVQETFAWLDELDPACCTTVPVEVA